MAHGFHAGLARAVCGAGLEVRPGRRGRCVAAESARAPARLSRARGRARDAGRAAGVQHPDPRGNRARRPGVCPRDAGPSFQRAGHCNARPASGTPAWFSDGELGAAQRNPPAVRSVCGACVGGWMPVGRGRQLRHAADVQDAGWRPSAAGNPPARFQRQRLRPAD